MSRPFIFSLVLFLSVVGLVNPCWADGVIRDAVGARTTGRGGVNVGFADNGQMILDNPAAIVNMPGQGLSELGLDLLLPDFEYADPDNARTDGTDNPFPTGQLAWAKQTLPDHNGRRFGFGLGIFSHAGFAAEYTLAGPVPLTGPRQYKSIGALARVLPAISIGINDRWSVGLNAGLAINHMELEGPYFLQGPSAFAGTPTLFDFQGTGIGFSYAGGLQYRATERTTLGFNYQGETRFRLDGTTRVTIPTLGFSRFDSELAIAWPQSFTVGVKHEFDCCARVGLDVQLFDWSSSFDAFGITLTDPDSPTYQAVVGQRLDETFPLNWRDTVSIRLGGEQELGRRRVVRAGYVYHRNPVPDATLTPFLQATLEHAVSVGYGWWFLGNEWDAAYQYSFGRDRQVVNSQFLGGDFDGSTVGTKAHWVSLSVIRRF